MRRLVVIVFCLIFFVCNVFGYYPTQDDKFLLTKIKSKVIKLKDLNKEDVLIHYNNLISKALTKIQDPRAFYILSKTQRYINIKLGNINPTKDILANLNDIVGGYDFNKRCLDKYPIVDDIAKKYDFPTVFILAFWQVEHGCFFKIEF